MGDGGVCNLTSRRPTFPPLSEAVSSALWSLTAVFGMGTGVASRVKPRRRVKISSFEIEKGAGEALSKETSWISRDRASVRIVTGNSRRLAFWFRLSAKAQTAALDGLSSKGLRDLHLWMQLIDERSSQWTN